VDAIEHRTKRSQDQYQHNAADDQQCFAAAGRLWRLRGLWRRLRRLLRDGLLGDRWLRDWRL
jgi:hypothetical protein